MKKIFFALVIVSLFSGCLKSSEGTYCNYNACGFVAPPAEVKMVEDYLLAQGITAAKHCSGLYYRIDQEGTGQPPTACSTVDVNYVGRLTNGNVFDQSNGTVTFSLLQLITSWKNGLPLIKPGGRIQLYVPPSLGYGSQQVGSIPSNSVLIFQVDLLGVR